MKYFISITSLLFLFATTANAQTHQNTYSDWSVYTVIEDGQKLCYAISFPTSKGGNYNYRSKPYAMVTALGNGEAEFSVTSGYKYKPGTEPRVQIDKNKYKISLTQGEMAWPKTDTYDNKIISKMKKGWKMKVTGTSVKGTYSIDTYSLKGFTNAYEKITALCS